MTAQPQNAEGHPRRAAKAATTSQPSASRRARQAARESARPQAHGGDPSPHPAGDGGEGAPDGLRAKAPRIARAPSKIPATFRTRESASQTEPGTKREAEVQMSCVPYEDPVSADLRFAHPTAAEIRELWRLRQDMARAEKSLTNQIRAICRRLAGGKVEGGKVYDSMMNGCAHPLAETAAAACAWLLAARQHPADGRKALEKRLTVLAKATPLWPWAEGVRGLGALSLAKVYGECGDPGAYRSEAALWKRAGLAVIDGGRQRLVGGDAALAHGYSPERRSTFFVVADCLLKAQGKGEAAGPYRRIYDDRKALERPRVESDGHAHNRAMRFMTKRLLRDAFRVARQFSRMAE